jgi:peptidylprolyl isomerase
LALGSAPLASAGVAGAAASTDLGAVQVSGNPGEKPTVTSEWPLKVRSSVAEERTKGAGATAAKGDRLFIDYVILNGRTGQELETSYGRAPVGLELKRGTTPALRKGLLGSSVGSRVLVAVAPEDGLTKGGAQVGLKKNDTVLFVVDVKSVSTPLTRATGTPVTPPAGLPEVTLAKNGAPKIAVPETNAPTSLVVQPLIEGDGPVVQAGQTLDVHYTGVLWDSGKTFDSSWSRGQSAQIGVGEGIAGWNEGLVGQKVGSQILLVIPPDKGYGSAGNPQAGISGTDTIVFVVDILGAS